MGQFSRRLISLVGLFALFFGSFAGLPTGQVAQAQTTNPTSVTLVGSLQSELGCGGDWDPTCAATMLGYDDGDDVWQGTWTVPQGSWEYKTALNGGWAENYGANAAPNGANILLSLAGAADVKFYYDHKTHWITDNVNSVIVTVPGSFQGELGCPGDWQPDCLRSWLQDVDDDGIYTFETRTLPAGTYEGKATINESWDENYGQGGVRDGANIIFTVPVDGAKVSFTYTAPTHVLTIKAGHAPDNNVEWDGLRHDSRDLLYRTPGGAVPAGTMVKLRLRTFHNDVTDVKARVYSPDLGQSIFPMTVAASNVSCYQADLESETCDFWEVVLPNSTPDNLWYRFIISDGSHSAYYADNTGALDGGVGAVSTDPVDNSYALTVYDPGFISPSWMRRSVVYQIFPDRFRNGKESNDPETGMPRYDDPAILLPWGTLPEGYCRNYADADPVTCPWRYDPALVGDSKESPRGRDYYGGDLKGVIEKLDYLKALGVTQIYFNPIFEAKSNHRYDTSDYTQIDPTLGTQADFNKLVSEAKKRGIKIMLDGVFNHMSSDSPFFDRYQHFASLGACEYAVSQWRSWFYFREPGLGEPSPCVPSVDGGADTYYTGWFGFDSIPVIDKTNPAVQEYFITGSNSITQTWLARGIYGWRLDVMGDSSFPAGYWETFRTVVKNKQPNAVIVGELWQKDSTLLRFLRGDRADTTMNYRLRDAVIGLLAPGPFDSKGFADSGRVLAPSEFAARILSIREDYPDAAYFSLMNLLDSHDTERVLWTLTPGQDTRAEKEFNPANLEAGKQRVKLASLIQFTMPGAPTIYYGDEVGMTGDDDPDDRRTFPWPDLGGSPDLTMAAHYKALSQLYRGYEPLANGDIRMLLVSDADRLLAYGRKTDLGAVIVVLNLGEGQQTITVPVQGYLPNQTLLRPVYTVGGSTNGLTVVSEGALQVSLDGMSALVLATGKINLAPPPAPTGVFASEGAGQVSLEWAAVPGVAGYHVYRSPLSGGGFVRVNSALVTSTNFTDAGLQNGVQYFYVVRSVNDKGIESVPSTEVSAMPHLVIGWANLQWPPDMTHTISVTNRTNTAYGQVWIDGETSQPGATPTLWAQLGFGPSGSNPNGNPDWMWVDASFNTNAGNNDEFMASMLPEGTGSYDYVYRYSTTNGREWLYADLSGPVPAGLAPGAPGKLTVNASDDTISPAVPINLSVISASPDGIELAWDAVSGDPSLFGYEVLRSDVSGGPYSMVARVTGTDYIDEAVVEGATYFYVVRSLDASFNRSEISTEVAATAALRTVSLVFNLTVPASTDGTLRSVYIAGFLDRLDGGLPQWNPGGVVLTRVDDTHWTITLTGKETTQIEYKYTLGDWDHVEKGAACDEISNRILTLSFGDSGIHTVNDTVLNWRNVLPCGN